MTWIKNHTVLRAVELKYPHLKQKKRQMYVSTPTPTALYCEPASTNLQQFNALLKDTMGTEPGQSEFSISGTACCCFHADCRKT